MGKKTPKEPQIWSPDFRAPRAKKSRQVCGGGSPRGGGAAPALFSSRQSRERRGRAHLRAVRPAVRPSGHSSVLTVPACPPARRPPGARGAAGGERLRSHGRGPPPTTLVGGGQCFLQLLSGSPKAGAGSGRCWGFAIPCPTPGFHWERRC